MQEKTHHFAALGRFRQISRAEGWSYLVLLFAAMPLKYFLDFPAAVTYVGWLHGFLFVLYMTYGLYIALLLSWSVKRVALAVLAALLPFGPFVFDKSLHAEQEQLRSR